MKTKIQTIETNALKIAVTLYVQGNGLTHAVRMANARIAQHAADSGMKIEPAMMLANHQLHYRVKKDGQLHHYNKILTPVQIRDMKKLREKGWTYQAIATKYGVSLCTARNNIKA